MVVFKVFRLWLKWHNHWDDLCNCCGKCCYSRFVTEDGTVIINYFRPCENLDTKTNLCTIYPDRLKKCNHCRKVNLWVALFNPTLPNDCPYATTFRVWENGGKRHKRRKPVAVGTKRTKKGKDAGKSDIDDEDTTED